jgi:hypothetical protein
MGSFIRSGLPDDDDGSSCTLPNGNPPLISGTHVDHHALLPRRVRLHRWCYRRHHNQEVGRRWQDGFSLADVGYAGVGIDEGWGGCGFGVNKTQHAANGGPVINKYRFPDMEKLVKYGHDAGVIKMGWCQNGW